MCGIVGFSGQSDERRLRAATSALNHRGPDDSGIFYDQASNVGLGHTRLSIIDLSPLGSQPMVSKDNNVVLSFNGEIYNFQELRLQLKAKGYVFKGSSDTEVVLNMYLEYGIGCLSKLNGIFGLAFYDRELGDIFVARDGLGVKPIYYHSGDKLVSFSSEIKSLLELVPDGLMPDFEALQRYMTFLWCPGDGTPIKSIKKLLPGEVITIRAGKIVDRVNWFDLPQSKIVKKISSANDAVIQVRQSLFRAVERQMVADVPVGAFLSGGLDSSAIVALASQITPDLQCFTIEPIGGSDDDVVEDLPYAVEVANHLGVDLEIVKIDSSNLANDLVEMVWQLDEPLADPAPLNVLYISQLARKRGIKVLLSGSGGDDLFTGYRRHLALRYEGLWSWLPKTARQGLESFSLGLNQSKTLGRRLSRLFNNASASGDERLTAYFAWARRDDLEPLFSPEMRNAVKSIRPEQPMLDFLGGVDLGLSAIDRMLTLEQRFFLADHNLIYTDKMSMAAGLEVRVPFLDLDLVELAASIPDQLKQKGRIGKWVLKKAMEPYLPHDVIYRPKTGFGAPLRRWIKHDLRDLISEVLSVQSIQSRGLFNAVAVCELIADNKSGRRDAAYTIFSLLCIEIWCRKFIDGGLQVASKEGVTL
jgi:asparagine synthase (glutamine-hydrolysing)